MEDTRRIEGIFAQYGSFEKSSMFSLIKSKVPELDQVEKSPEQIAITYYSDCVNKQKGLMIMPGTPVSELDDNELPSPRGSGAAEEGKKSTLPNYDPPSDDGARYKDPKDRFRLKIALEACL